MTVKTEDSQKFGAAPPQAPDTHHLCHWTTTESQFIQY